MRQMWKEIPNTEGLYLISDKGRVFSVRSNRLLKRQYQSNGYERTELNINGVSKKYFVHRLVAEAFLPNPNNYPIVNHKDENPKNNCVDNLEWCTAKYNSNYGTCKERRVANTDYKRGADNPKSLKVYQFDLQGNFIAEYGSCREAAKATGLLANKISETRSGKRKQHGGFYWSDSREKFVYEARPNAQFRKGAILMIDSKGNVIKRYETPRELEKDGFRQISVNRVCRGERNTYKGYLFKHE